MPLSKLTATSSLDMLCMLIYIFYFFEIILSGRHCAGVYRKCWPYYKCPINQAALDQTNRLSAVGFLFIYFLFFTDVRTLHWKHLGPIIHNSITIRPSSFVKWLWARGKKNRKSQRRDLNLMNCGFSEMCVRYFALYILPIKYFRSHAIGLNVSRD